MLQRQSDLGKKTATLSSFSEVKKHFKSFTCRTVVWAGQRHDEKIVQIISGFVWTIPLHWHLTSTAALETKLTSTQLVGCIRL